MHAPPTKPAAALGLFRAQLATLHHLGYSPVPLFPCGSTIKGKLRDKSPCFLEWSPKLRERVITPAEAKSRVSHVPNAEIGAVCAFNRLTGVDIDTLDKKLQAIVLAVLPPAPTRLGNPAKAGLLLYQWGGDGDPVTKRFADKNNDMIVETSRRRRAIRHAAEHASERRRLSHVLRRHSAGRRPAHSASRAY